MADNPLHEANVQSRFDVCRFLMLDAAYYYDDAIKGLLPPVNRFDLGVSTVQIRGFTLSVWGRNLQQDRHVEAIPAAYLLGEIRRSIEFKLVWQSTEDHHKVGQ